MILCSSGRYDKPTVNTRLNRTNNLNNLISPNIEKHLQIKKTGANLITDKNKRNTGTTKEGREKKYFKNIFTC